MDAHTVINVMRVEAVMMAGVFVAAAVLSHSMPGSALRGLTSRALIRSRACELTIGAQKSATAQPMILPCSSTNAVCELPRKITSSNLRQAEHDRRTDEPARDRRDAPAMLRPDSRRHHARHAQRDERADRQLGSDVFIGKDVPHDRSRSFLVTVGKRMCKKLGQYVRQNADRARRSQKPAMPKQSERVLGPRVRLSPFTAFTYASIAAPIDPAARPS